MGGGGIIVSMSTPTSEMSCKCRNPGCGRSFDSWGRLGAHVKIPTGNPECAAYYSALRDQRPKRRKRVLSAGSSVSALATSGAAASSALCNTASATGSAAEDMKPAEESGSPLIPVRLLTDARFAGAWTLASFTSTAADGTVTHPYGEGVRGSIVYTADGTVAYQLVGGEGGGAASRARRFASRDFLRGTDAELAAAARAARSYVGAWHAADGVVTHALSLSVHADREGRTMRRHFEFRADGDELSLVPVTRPGAPREELVWRRVGRAEAVAAAAAAAAAADAADADDARAAAGRAT